MQITMLVADYANVTDNGKLNVLGIFDQIYAKQFPVRHNALMIVAKIRLDIGEKPVRRELAIRLLDEDGNFILELTGELQFPPSQGGSLPEVNIVTGINGVVFPKPGRYEFRLLINEEFKSSIPIQVSQVELSE